MKTRFSIPRNLVTRLKMAGLLSVAAAVWFNSGLCFAQVTPPNPQPPNPPAPVAPAPRPAPKPEPKAEPAPVPEVVLPPVQTRIEQPMMPMRVLGPGPVLRFQLDLSRLPELTLLPPLRREEEE